MKYVRVACCFGVFVVFSNFSVGADKIDLCNFDEVMVATCTLREAKARTASFCSSLDRKTMMYRFGKNSDIELEVSFSGRSRMSRWLDLGPYTTYFGFRVSEYSYVLGVPEERYGAEAFFIVARNDKTVRDSGCLQNSFGEKTLKNSAIEDVADKDVRGNKFLFPPLRYNRL